MQLWKFIVRAINLMTTYLIAGDIAELIDCNVFIQMASHHNRVSISWRLQNPNLLLFQGFAISIDFVAKSLSTKEKLEEK